MLCCLAAACSPGRHALVASPDIQADGAVLEVPFFPQKELQCGPAALAMALAWSGVDIGPDALVAEVFTPNREGSLQADLVTAARRRDRIAFPITGTAELAAEITARHPVIVLQNLGLTWLPRMHYAVVIGRSNAGAWVLHSGRNRERSVGPRTFANTWTRAGAWGLVVLRPDHMPASANERRWLEAALGLEQAGQLHAAATAYRAALERWPESLAAAIGLANAAYAAGDLETAERSLRLAVERHPSAADAWNNLGHVLHVRGARAEAVAATCRAIEIGGGDPSRYTATLAEIAPQARCGAAR